MIGEEQFWNTNTEVSATSCAGDLLRRLDKRLINVKRCSCRQTQKTSKANSKDFKNNTCVYGC